MFELLQILKTASDMDFQSQVTDAVNRQAAVIQQQAAQIDSLQQANLIQWLAIGVAVAYAVVMTVYLDHRCDKQRQRLATIERELSVAKV